MDQSPAASLASAVSSPSNVPSSIERLRAKASYNEAYKEANHQKIELGTKRLKMLESELDKVKLVGLVALYDDLRQDLRDARESGDADDVRSIKEQMRTVQKQRRDLMAT